MFCQAPGAPPQNYMYSGMDELQSLLNSVSLLFNPNNAVKVILDPNIVQILTIQETNNGSNLYKSRQQFNKKQEYHISDQNILTNILALQEYPYRVISATYGCNHDFFDTRTANLSYKTLKDYFYPHFDTLNKKVKDVLIKFEDGLNITNTTSLHNIWERNQDDIDKILASINFSFPTVNTLITREKPDTISEESKQLSKDASKQSDMQNILLFLNNYEIDPGRIVWVVDTFQSWLEHVSSRKLDMKGTIAEIDGATSSISGSEKLTSDQKSKVDKLQIGPYLFVNNPSQNVIDILKGNDVIAKCAYGASVTTIVNLISYSFNRELTGASRSGIRSLYNLHFEYKYNFSDEEKILIAEFVKAAGDQAPIDICNYYLSQQASDDNSILIFTTGDLLAYQTAKSLGLAAFFISSSKILFTIPTSLISLDLTTPVLNNFVFKFKQMCDFYKNIEAFEEIIQKVNALKNFSAAGQITSYKFFEQFDIYLKKIIEDTNIIRTAYYKLSLCSQTKPITHAELQQYIDFYNYIKTNLNRVNFAPDKLYDFLFSSKSDQYKSYTYTNDQFSIVEQEPDIPPEEDDDNPNYKVITFCDSSLDANCINDNSTHIKGSVVEYVNKNCEQNDTKCIEKYIGQYGSLKAIPLPVQKKYVYKNLLADQGTVDEGWLLVGEIMIIDYKRSTYGGTIELDNNNMPITLHIPAPATSDDKFVPLSVLENIIQSSLLDTFWQIPYEAFILPYLQSGERDIIKIEKTMKYLIKALQFSLQDLYIETIDETLVNTVLYLLIDYAKCPPASVNENGQIVDSIDSEETSKRRSGRGKSGLVGSKLSFQQGRKHINNFLINVCYLYGPLVPSTGGPNNLQNFINAVLQINNDEDFKNFRGTDFLNNYQHEDMNIIQQQIDDFYSKMYFDYSTLQSSIDNKIQEHHIPQLQSNGSEITTPNYETHIGNLVVKQSLQTAGYNKTKKKNIQKTKRKNKKLKEKPKRNKTKNRKKKSKSKRKTKK